MQAPPAFSLTVTHFGVWHALRLALAVSACAVAGTWGWHPHAPVAQAVMLPWLVAAFAAVVLLRHTPAFRLRWDTRGWTVDGRAARLQVALDAGHWMLLRARPLAGGRGRWLPVQRLGHESAWHLFRCTVHGARPVADRWTDTP
jgi:hypothetical protein